MMSAEWLLSLLMRLIRLMRPLRSPCAIHIYYAGYATVVLVLSSLRPTGLIHPHELSLGGIIVKLMSMTAVLASANSQSAIGKRPMPSQMSDETDHDSHASD